MKRYLTLWLLALTLLGWAQPTPSPVPLDQATPSATPTVPADPTPLATPVRTSGVKQQDVEGLAIEAFPLFRIAGTETMTAQARVEMVRVRVQHLIDLYPTDPPPVRVDQVAGATVVRAGDHILITVTDQDVPEFDLSRQPPEVRRQLEYEVANLWRDALEKEINLAATMRTPAYRKFALSLVVTILVLGALIHKGLNWAGRRHFHSPLWSVKFLLWSGAAFMALRLFPTTRAWADSLYTSVLYPYVLLVLVFVLTKVFSLLAERMVSRYFFALQESSESVHLSRLGLRLATLDQAARVTVRVLLLMVGGLVYLLLLDVDLGAIVTGAGVVGVTVGLATQDLIKNVLAGVNILVEDHFGIGDVIEVNGVNGTVETFHLRCTQIRTVDGRLVVVPNNQLVMVQNHSNGWGRVDFRVEVAYKEDLGRALEVLYDEALKLSDEWEEQITEPPVMMGVEALGANGVTLRLLLRTIPLSQWSVKRELNRRVKDRFDQESIEIPFPQQVVWRRDPGADTTEGNSPENDT